MPSASRPASAVLAAALLAAGALAARDAPAPSWLRVETEHFSLFGNRPGEELVEAAVELERLRNVLSQLAAGTRFERFLPARLYLFRDQVSYAPFRLPGGLLNAGYLLPGDEATYGAIVGGRPSHLIFKQYVRDFLELQLPGLPAWLRFGLAEYYSTFEADDAEARLGLPVERHLERFSRYGVELIPVAKILPATKISVLDGKPHPAAAELPVSLAEPGGEVDPGAVFVADPPPFYPQSWAMVHYLMSDESRRLGMADYIRRVQGGEDPVAAFRAAIETDLEAFDRALAHYVGGTSFTFLRVPVEARAGGPPAAEPLTPAATAFHLGDLLLRLGASHRDAAGVRLRRAVELDPGHGVAWAGLGRLAEEAGDQEAALAHYERAVALDPDDFETRLRFGHAKLRSLGGRRASDEAGEAAVAAALAAFRRAAELRPDAPRVGEAWAGLGQAGVLAAEPSAEAVAALERALELLPPGRTDVLFNLLLARARLGDAAGVDRAAAELRAAGADAELLSRAREVRLQLSLQEARHLATSDRIDDAVALLAMVRAETANPAVAEQASALFDKLSRAEAHNRFVERYMDAVRLYQAGELAAAAAVVDELSAEARPGRQTETLLALRARIEAGGPE